ncbi:6-phosphofructokinase [Halanaerobiaceae bacterium Z-7014]|uniref:ATP-dependent 6-phosphofructokinase n=1 Tax=Halonatronomonas betaini TaxID=2778430 RepID=A0A931ATH2_9FIRM|nr:6-phosphofructokinase [Halonatronomonas betaini]MBF8436500.1 6-phosphofructokinase [Halonatronomonas betaini]
MGKKIAVMTSGGDAPGMNPAIRSVVRTAIYYDMDVIGIKHGYSGMIEGNFEAMYRGSVADIIHRGGTILHSARCPEFETVEGRKQAIENLKREGIEGVVIIGGDGSLQGAEKLAEESDIRVVGIPGTIDNDLGGTDYCLGFDTAMNTVIDGVNKIRDTATSHERTFIIEVMGRHSGDLALMSGLASGAEYILIPEIKFSSKDVCDKIQQGYERGKLHSIIMVAEGVDEDLKPNRKKSESPAFDLSNEIEERTGLETRVIILGHLQRGGSPTAMDRILASRMGFEAVKLLRDGKNKLMVGYRNHEIISTSLSEVLKEKDKINHEIVELAHILSL